jgi:hypothetical protein
MKITIEHVGKDHWVWDTYAVDGRMHGEAVDLFSAVESLKEFLKYGGHLPWDPTTERLPTVELLHNVLKDIPRN